MVDAPTSETVTTTAAETVESIVWRNSKCIYAYDVALEQGVGIQAKAWKAAGQQGPQVIEMETRAGAGLAVAGRLSEGTSSEGAASSPFVLSVLTTPAGLAQMVPALEGLPSESASAKNRAVFQVPAVTSLPGSLALSPSLHQLTSVLPILPEQVSIILSSTAQETLDLASLAYSVTTSHVVHLFDHYASARELSKLSVPVAVPHDHSSSVSIQRALNKAGYNLFDYFGSNSATDVFVVVNGTIASAVKAAVEASTTVGVVVVRLLRPWDSAKFLAALPSSTKKLHVLDDVATSYTEGPLYQDVLATVLESPSTSPIVHSVRVTPADTQAYLSSPAALFASLSALVPRLTVEEVKEPETKKIAFWSSGCTLSSLSEKVAQGFLGTKSIYTRLVKNSDVFAKPGGITLSRLLLASSPVDKSVETVLPLGADNGTHVIAIADASLLTSHDILRTANPGSPILVYTSLTPDELITGLHPATLELIRERDLAIYAFDTQKHGDEALQEALAHAAFLRLYVGGTGSMDVLERIARSVLGGASIAGTPVEKLVELVWKGLVSVNIPAPAPVVATNGSSKKPVAEIAPLKQFEFNTISLSGFSELIEGSERNGPISGPWHEAAKHLLFPEAYSVLPPPNAESTPEVTALRPELPIQTYLVTCTVNKRLTPRSYDRNVFHMELDTTGTGLTYKVGEALGVHGWNDEADVLEFCKWYDVDPDAVISVPVHAAQGGTGALEGRRKVTRTVFQALQQQIDLFGRPPKSFYAALATYAKDKRERLALLFIAAPEGASTLKKLGEKDTVNYAEVLAMYPSARPSIEELAVIVEEIKERHYSIASAQSFVGNRVDLLIVTVEWATPSGTPKYGQCTRYLANLKVGSQVTVSIKPSVMKLPPSDLQPIIMAGLGTGAAPFRAFIQHRSLLKSQGKPVGPMVYYFGSRHRSQEYLYGEELEAYIKDGVVTHAGLAFSRDSDSKVYIQHKMQQDGEYLAALFSGDSKTPAKEGYFYLCGPTWPVPDVHEALVKAFTTYGGKTVDGAADFIEQLKEDERYVLEVY